MSVRTLKGHHVHVFMAQIRMHIRTLIVFRMIDFKESLVILSEFHSLTARVVFFFSFIILVPLV